ncbi:5'-3' exonuclease family protein [Trifolium repens]|nr:5'-3' exonuclease family protein [Trifolium repens]
MMMKSLQTTNASSSPSHTFNFIHPSNFNPSSSLSFKTTPKTTALTATAATTTTVTQKPKRVFFLDVNPLCYEGTNPSLHSFAKWLSLFLSPQVAHNHPVIAVVDGERGSEHRRKLLPSYKANRRKFTTSGGGSAGYVGRFHPVISDVLRKCNVPVIKVDGHEADDVVATLAEQVLKKGFRVVIASPDKDFKQLISDDVQIVMPLPELQRWSFYTMRHYRDQYNCDPESDLSLRCIVGDEVDGVPGIQNLVPNFGWKTALKLVRKHGSLEALLNAAAVRTVGKPYAQDALKNHADYLRRNYEVLALKRDVNVQLYEEWLVERDTHNDTIALSTLFKYLEESKPMRNSVSNRPAITSKYVRKKHKNQVSVGAEVM